MLRAANIFNGVLWLERSERNGYKMKIIAHRGFWIEEREKNTLYALERALKNGYGIETDLRDYKEDLVISHNIANEKSIKLEDFFQLYCECGNRALLALNVKADGIQKMLETLLVKYDIENYFLFDMSIPELVVNSSRNLRFYTRSSDIERECVLYDKAAGIWVDAFYDENWLDEKVVMRHIKANKEVCLVSPELHGNDFTRVWKLLKETGLYKNDLLALCTDMPDSAEEYFNEYNKSNFI